MNRSGTSSLPFERADHAMPGIAALESPQAQNSRREIRSLIEEIAQLAHSDAAPAEFFSGFLSRVMSAIGATAGAIWQYSPAPIMASPGIDPAIVDGQASHCLTLVSSLYLPPSLLADPQTPSSQHSALLAAVAADGGPVLVPPGNVKLEVKRPANPLDQSLIIVPVIVRESIEFLVEIVQRPSGGPAAQRGYLRFVAQMADLFADHQRQIRLRTMSREQQRLRQMSQALVGLASRRGHSDKQRAAVQAFRTIVGCEHALLLRHASQPRVVAIADTGSFDRRSELILAIEQMISRWQKTGQPAGRSRMERIHVGQQNVIDAERMSAVECDQSLHELAQRVSQQLDAQWLAWLPLNRVDDRELVYSVLLAGRDESLEACDAFETAALESSESFPVAVGELLSAAVSGPSLHGLGGMLRRTLLPGQRTTWMVRGGMALALLGLACLPLPQRISAPATLRPVDQQHYFAPGEGVVEQVFVKDGELVAAGQMLVKVENIELDAIILRLESQNNRLRELISGLNERLGKLGRSSGVEASELELQLHRTEGELESVESELALRREQREQLSIRARNSGRASLRRSPDEWTGRHVTINDRLLSVYAPEGRWRFEIALPERRLGLLAAAGKAAAGTRPARITPNNRVTLAISGYPEQPLYGQLDRLAEHTSESTQPAQSHQPERILLADSYFTADALPALKDGLQAKATIDCGQQPLIWLLIRDAYQSAVSSVRLWW